MCVYVVLVLLCAVNTPGLAFDSHTCHHDDDVYFDIPLCRAIRPWVFILQTDVYLRTNFYYFTNNATKLQGE